MAGTEVYNKESADAGKPLPFWERRGLAVLALALCVILSITLGTARSAGALRSNTESIYESSRAMSDVKIIFASAEEISAVYRAIVGENGRWQDYVNAVASAGDPGSAVGLDGEAVGLVKTICAAMYNELVYEGKMTDAQSTSAMKYYYDLLNAWTMLCENGEYRVAADKYNAAADAFPLNMLGTKWAAIFR